jgi:hypothetical protein
MAAPTKKTGPRFADPDGLRSRKLANFSDRVVAVFPGANLSSPGLRNLLNEAVPLSISNPARRELLFDHNVLIRAAIDMGIASKRDLDSSRWFAQGLGVKQSAELRDRINRDEPVLDNLDLLIEGYKPACSQLLIDQVLPRALELASRTMLGRDTFDQRHLLMALLEIPTELWPDIGTPVTAKLRAQARKHIVEMTGESPVKGESMRAWREVLAEIPDKDDRLSAQRDQPAVVDELGRDKFAQVVANRLCEVRVGQKAEKTRTGDQSTKRVAHSSQDDVDRAYFVHLDGPWGSGKSSIINFLKADLRKRDPAWLIVDFNAWREQKNQPPWWALIVQIVRRVGGQLSGWDHMRFRAIWWWWLFWNRWAGMTLAAVFLGLALYLFWFAAPDKVWGTVKDVLAVVTGIGGLAALFRTAMLGSAFSAKALEELRDDPYAPVMAVFHDLVECAQRPILVIIDDLDRCDSAYVVALLENVQTMLRAEPISYLVAGDRKWITTSFANRYGEFCDSLGGPGRPLGHLFLEKLFQLSVTVPRFEASQLVTYWQSLLKSPEAKAAEVRERTASDAQARQILGNESRPEVLQEKIDAAAESPQLQQSLREHAAVAIASPSNLKELESRYAHFGPYLDRNPRAMKRLVNALGVKQSVLFLEGRKVDPDLLARWTIIELRWPLLAEALEANPEWLDPSATERPVAPYDAWLELDGVELVLNGFDGASRIDSSVLDELFGQQRPKAAASPQ